MNNLIIITILLPLVSSLVSSIGIINPKTENKKFVTRFSCVALSLSAIFSVFIFNNVVIGEAKYNLLISEWIRSGSLNVNWSIMVDSLTAVMLLVVTSVSAMVHIYSLGYMSHDPHLPRFMSYISLFSFCMLMLVTSDNFVQLFFGWEGVGFCSYLLIGFWFKKNEANAAAIKAFLVNRVADVFFVVGIAMIYYIFGSIQFEEVFPHVAKFTERPISFLGNNFEVLEVICLLLFIGAMGKSAQILFHTWLPDAMEGPTPVSALIHAATMVTAGIFLVVRCSPLFEFAPMTLSIVAIVGAITAIFAATIALTQNDIKKVIAYSTCSQLGYMFLACGVSAYAAAIFHLATHAFFKSLLFLSAGSVIHAMSGEQNMQKMGGLYKKLPYSCMFFWIGSAALAGLPMLSGYYSKDLILESVYANGGSITDFVFWIGVFTSVLTAFYSWRVIYMTFYGKIRAEKEVIKKLHESPKIMLLPLGFLAIGAVFSGAVGYYLGIANEDLSFWNSSIYLANNEFMSKIHHLPKWVYYAPLLAAILGILLSTKLYLLSPSLPKKIANIFHPIYTLFYNKWYFDELYHIVFVLPIQRFAKLIWKYLDIGFIDNFGPNGAAKIVLKISQLTHKIQTGMVYHYAFAMLLGLLLFLFAINYLILR